MSVVFPTVNLNGTDIESLMEENSKAREALQNAIRALSQAAPNGRDYQTCWPGAFRTAQAQHYDRLQGLAEILKEMEEIALGIDGQRK